MADEKTQPGEVTERFQAFADRVDPAPSRTLPVALIIGAVVLVGALVAALVVILA